MFTADGASSELGTIDRAILWACIDQALFERCVDLSLLSGCGVNLAQVITADWVAKELGTVDVANLWTHLGGALVEGAFFVANKMASTWAYARPVAWINGNVILCTR